MSAMPLSNAPLSASALSLTVEEERALLRGIAHAEDELAQALVVAGRDVAGGGDVHAGRTALKLAASEASGSSSSDRRVRALAATLDRLFWRLALSGLDQLEHALRKHSYERVTVDELRQAGMLGLYRAAWRFDGSRNLRFSTYCRYWVRDALGEQAGRLEYVARLPSKARRQLKSDPSELSDRQAQALEGVKKSVSIDARLPDGSRTLSDTLADDGDVAHPEQMVIQSRRLSLLHRALEAGNLDDRQRLILHHRFGLNGADTRTCRQLGMQLGISAERVRQLQNKAIQTLRSAL